MAHIFPPVYPGIVDSADPEFVVFESLKKLSDDFFIFYSKRFKGVEKAKEEVEIDFIIFDGKKTILCLEVKGGELSYDPAMQSWLQNGNTMKVGPDRQATAACHSLIRYMGNRVKNINVDWALCFPCSKPSARIPEMIRILYQVISFELRNHSWNFLFCNRHKEISFQARGEDI